MIDLRNCCCFELLKSLPNNSIDCIVTDPPYNVLGKHKIETNIDMELFFNESFRVMKKDSFIAFFCQEPTASDWAVICKQKTKLKYRNEIIWNKKNVSHPGIYPLHIHEKVYIFSKGSAKFQEVRVCEIDRAKEIRESLSLDKIIEQYSYMLKMLKEHTTTDVVIEKLEKMATMPYIRDPKGLREIGSLKSIKNRNPKCDFANRILNGSKISTIWSYHPDKFKNRKYNHPTVKPIFILDRLIRLLLPEQDRDKYTILDPFLGSGSTGVVAKQLGYNFIGSELDKGYFETAKNRIDDILL